MKIIELQNLWDSFLARWPREKLQDLTLEQYVSVNDNDTFTYWLETGTWDLGSIKGNTSAKFGIYKRNGEGKPQSGIAHGEVYTWRTRYGNNEQEVFAYVKDTLIKVANAAFDGDLQTIENIDFAPLVKWKIAFLYQNQQVPSLINTFSKPMLQVLTSNDAKVSFPTMYQQLIADKGDENLLQYGEKCWKRAAQKHKEIEQQDILNHFSHIEAFNKCLPHWSEQIVDAFCAVIKEARNYKLDVFNTAMTSGRMIRIGRKELNAFKAEEVFATFEPTKHKINFELRHENRNGYYCTEVNDELFNFLRKSKQLEKFQQQHSITRKPYWPANYNDDDFADDSIDDDGIEETTEVYHMEHVAPLNQILYGPPGTGKTYHTIEAAVKAAEPGFNWEGDRTRLREEYERLVSEKRIRFVTFHQSYGYEEFVEGLRAVTNDDGQLSYKVEPGIFRNAVESARAKRFSKLDLSSGYDLSERNIWKMSLGNTQTAEGEMIFKECIENDYILLGYGGNIDFKGCKSTGKIKEKFIEAGYELKPQDYNVTAVNTLVNKMSVGDLVIISDGNYKFKAIAEITSDYACLDDDRDWYFQKRDVKWLMTFDESRPVEELFSSSLSQMTLYNLKDSVISREKLSNLLNGSKQQLEEVKNHVLIIDEINRGNISKIFGELITLIEPSKRQGQPEALELTLPYSGNALSVPSNLHIIGTMNTADRSLAMMDTALRRRFDFVEMMPKPNLLSSENEVKGIDLEQLLKVMNQRIEILYDREHTLGHAFFMPVKALIDNGEEELAFTELQSVFQNKIIPLLEEYFFEDWDKIRLVLADNQKAEHFQFVIESELEQSALNVLFGNKHGLGQFGEVQKQYSLKDKEAPVWKLALAYKGIYAPNEIKNPESNASTNNKTPDEVRASQLEAEATGAE